MILKIETAEFVRSAVVSGDFLRDDLPEVAFSGRSNVGKSSLINRLLKRKALARTSSTPGRTRAVNYFLINHRFYFVDLPGYGYAKAGRQDRRRWAQTVDQYLQNVKLAAAMVLLVDGKTGATALDEQAVDYLDALEQNLMVAVTKIDRVPRSKRSRRLREIRERLELGDDYPLLSVSARTGEGIPGLWRELSERL